MKNLVLILSLAIVLAAIPQLTEAKNSINLTDLRCNNITHPNGIHHPLLSWKITGPGMGISQAAWEVEIGSSRQVLLANKADVWRSGRQISSEQFNIDPENVQWQDGKEYYWRVRIWDQNNQITAWSKPAFFSTGLLESDSWKGKWITYRDAQKNELPYFRKVMNLQNGKIPIKRAMVYLCGLGASELYINGRQVDSTRFLDPAQTNYENYALYSALNVTRYVHPGSNCFGIMIGNGWFSQTGAWLGAPFRYGDPMFRFQLIIDYADGTRRIEGSDESWTWKSGPILKSNIYLGESYDADKEIVGWCDPYKEITGWESAIVAKQNIPPKLLPQLINPIRTREVLKPVKFWKTADDKWVFDFGINTAAIPLLDVVQPAGTKLEVRIAEEKKSNGEPDFTSLGWIHHGAIFTDTYICKGGGKTEKWKPRFTYHGFRYAELSGFKGTPDASTLKMIKVHTDLETTGHFDCSNPQINKLHELALNTVLSNMHGIPTDCPDREKCGWLGDVHAYAKMANMNFLMNNFWQKYLDDIHTGADVEEKKTLFHERYNSTFYFTDKPVGIPYMIAPGKRLCGVASPDWGTTVVQLPWWQYVYSGDTEPLKNHYEDMKQWTDYVSSLATDTARTNKYGKNTRYIIYQGLGDWCPPKYQNQHSTPVEFTSTAFHYLDVSIMANTAERLDKRSDAIKYNRLKTEIAAEMIAELYDAVNKTYGSQTADVMALDLGLVPVKDRESVAAAVEKDMQQNSDGFLNTGIFGIGRIGSMLARNGQSDAAWKMFTKKGENSFEYMWKDASATSLWETLPVNKLSKELAAPGSLNHAMQAGYDICFYEDIAGIRPDSMGYGFKVIRFEPQFTNHLSRAAAKVESLYGTVFSSWRRTTKGLQWIIQIPHNTTGLVVLPATGQILINGKLLNTNVYKPVRVSGSLTTYLFPSGTFNIMVK